MRAFIAAFLLTITAGVVAQTSGGGYPSRPTFAVVTTPSIVARGSGLSISGSGGTIALTGPVSIGGNTLNSAALVKIASGLVNGVGALQPNALYINSASNGGTGVYTVNYTAAGFTHTPFCNVTGGNGGLTAFQIGSQSTTTAQVFSNTTSTGAAANNAFHITCVGL